MREAHRKRFLLASYPRSQVALGNALAEAFVLPIVPGRFRVLAKRALAKNSVILSEGEREANLARRFRRAEVEGPVMPWWKARPQRDAWRPKAARVPPQDGSHPRSGGSKEKGPGPSASLRMTDSG